MRPSAPGAHDDNHVKPVIKRYRGLSRAAGREPETDTLLSMSVAAVWCSRERRWSAGLPRSRGVAGWSRSSERAPRESM